MAKTGKIEKNNKRKKLVARFSKKRQELRQKAKDVRLSPEDRDEARKKLQAMPRDTCENRIRNRCEVTGRPRAYMRKFGLSRNAFRILAHEAEIPGVTKSSW